MQVPAQLPDAQLRSSLYPAPRQSAAAPLPKFVQEGLKRTVSPQQLAPAAVQLVGMQLVPGGTTRPAFAPADPSHWQLLTPAGFGTDSKAPTTTGSTLGACSRSTNVGQGVHVCVCQQRNCMRVWPCLEQLLNQNHSSASWLAGSMRSIMAVLTYTLKYNMVWCC